MKYYFLFLLLSLTSTNTLTASPLPALAEGRFAADAVIRQLFEMMRRLIVNGDSSKGIPVMDPMVFEYGELEFPGQILRFNSMFSNASITGPGYFKLDRCQFDKEDLSVTMEMNFPSLVFDAGYYELTGDLWDALPLRGIGNFHAELITLRLRGKLYLKQSADGKAILLDKLENADFVVKQVSSQIDFDGVIDEIFNAIISDVFSRYITGANGLVIHTYSDSFIRRLNSYLQQYETWRLLAVIL